MKMKQLDLFLDTDVRHYDDLLPNITNKETRQNLITKLIAWRASEIKIPIEEYNKWIKND